MNNIPIMEYVRDLETKVRERDDEISRWQRVAANAVVHNGLLWVGVLVGMVVGFGVTKLGEVILRSLENATH